MSQAFFTSIAGMNVSQSKIDVVADNIANMNTVGFKSSNLNFQTVYSKLLSGGSSPTSTTGGTNPKQIGLGVTLGSISRDFTNGTVNSTGRTEDLNIQGNGFFTLKASDNSIVLTRDGNFSLDANGYMVNATGLRVLGTSSVYSTNGSDSYVKIPPELKLSVSGKDLTSADGDVINKLNNASITTGQFTFQIYNNVGTKYDVVVDCTGMTRLSEITTEINTQISALTGHPFGEGATASVQAAVNDDGTLDIAVVPSGTGSPDIIKYDAGEDDTSNFLSETGLTSAARKQVEGSSPVEYEYSSNILSYQATVGPFENINNSSTKSSYTMGKDGAIEVTYTNGDKIGIETEGNKKVLKYTTAKGVTIGSDDITVKSNVIEPSNLQVQLASVLNNEGLVARNGNTFALGPNTGTTTYSIGNTNGFGEVGSGGLESSNVNMSIEFANMILAQRAVEANSKTFSTISEVMRRIVNM